MNENIGEEDVDLSPRKEQRSLPKKTRKKKYFKRKDVIVKQILRQFKRYWQTQFQRFAARRNNQTTSPILPEKIAQDFISIKMGDIKYKKLVKTEDAFLEMKALIT